MVEKKFLRAQRDQDLSNQDYRKTRERDNRDNRKNVNDLSDHVTLENDRVKEILRRRIDQKIEDISQKYLPTPKFHLKICVVASIKIKTIKDTKTTQIINTHLQITNPEKTGAMSKISFYYSRNAARTKRYDSKNFRKYKD